MTLRRRVDGWLGVVLLGAGIAGCGGGDSEMFGDKPIGTTDTSSAGGAGGAATGGTGGAATGGAGGAGGAATGGAGGTGGAATGGAGGAGGAATGGSGGTGGACNAGEFQCSGDLLERCADDASGFNPVAACSPGLCDATGKQCDYCKADAANCLSATKLQTCSADGQNQGEVECAAATPYCAGDADSSRCVECLAASDCPPSSSECALSACSIDGTCGSAPVTKGGPCGLPGAGGACDGKGACTYCTPGDTRCTGLTPETCDATGNWKQGASCAGSTPVCADGACVECLSTGDCPATNNDCVTPSCSATFTCTYPPKAANTTCGGGVGKCDGAGQCNACTPGTKICNGNVPLLCGANGQYASQPQCAGSTPQCDPGSGNCVACYNASQCPASVNECLSTTCSNNTCGYAPKTEGTACTGGTCNMTGVCQACAPGTKVCSGNGVLTCNASGQYDPVAACNAPKPYCNAATTTCVECMTPLQCTQPVNPCLQATCAGNSCGIANKANGTACAVSGDAGTCSAGACRVCTTGANRCKPGATDTTQTCDANGQWQDAQVCSGATPACTSGQCTCANNQTRCQGLAVQVCNGSGTWQTSQNCPFACDGGVCTGTCVPGSSQCVGNGIATCNASAQYDPAAACNAPKPYCNAATTTCVECTTPLQCTQPANPCLQATCTGNSCGIANKADGTTCAVSGDSGTCSAGSCRVCTTGANRCKPGATHTTQTCDANGQWQDAQACSGATPLCAGGACVAEAVVALRHQGPALGDAGANGAWALGSQGSIEYWVRFHTDSRMAVATAWDDSSTGGWFCQATSTSLQFAVKYATPQANLVATTSLSLDTWHHVACDYDGATMRLFVDGVLVSSKSYVGSFDSYTGHLIILHRNKWYSGNIGDYAVRAIRVGNKSLYTANFTPSSSPGLTMGTVSLWNANEGAGTSLANTVPGMPSIYLEGNTAWQSF